MLDFLSGPSSGGTGQDGLVVFGINSSGPYNSMTGKCQMEQVKPSPPNDLPPRPTQTFCLHPPVSISVFH